MSGIVKCQAIVKYGRIQEGDVAIWSACHLQEACSGNALTKLLQ